MRKIYISVIASILLFASCSDYLDVNSPSTFDKNYVFGSESEIATAVNGMYVPMVSGKGWVGVLLKKMLFNTDVEFSGLSTASNLNERAYVPSTGDIKSYGDIWTGMYDGVNRTNDVIEGIEQSPLFAAADKTKPSRLMQRKFCAPCIIWNLSETGVMCRTEEHLPEIRMNCLLGRQTAIRY